MGGPWSREYDELTVVALMGSGGREVIGARAPDVWEALRRLVVHEKMSDGQIAHALGRSRRSVQRTRTALGIEAVFAGGLDNAGNGRDLWSTAPSRPRTLK